jgi:hypothetical protein
MSGKIFSKTTAGRRLGQGFISLSSGSIAAVSPTGFLLLSDLTSNILLANKTDKLIRG